MIQLKHRSRANPSEINGNGKKKKQIAICLGSKKREKSGARWEVYTKKTDLKEGSKSSDGTVHHFYFFLIFQEAKQKDKRQISDTIYQVKQRKKSKGVETTSNWTRVAVNSIFSLEI